MRGSLLASKPTLSSSYRTADQVVAPHAQFKQDPEVLAAVHQVELGLAPVPRILLDSSGRLLVISGEQWDSKQNLHNWDVVITGAFSAFPVQVVHLTPKEQTENLLALNALMTRDPELLEPDHGTEDMDEPEDWETDDHFEEDEE